MQDLEGFQAVKSIVIEVTENGFLIESRGRYSSFLKLIDVLNFILEELEGRQRYHYGDSHAHVDICRDSSHLS
jgi:hypothetical protein